MISIDTNVLLRSIVHDDKKQARIAMDIIKNNCSIETPGFISSIVLCEFVWTLQTSFKYPKTSITATLSRIITAAEFFIEHHQEAWSALEDYKLFNADFSDYYIAHISKKYGAEKIVTFDIKAAGHAMFELIK